MRYGMVIDLKRCISCYACQMACKTENGTPPGVLYAWAYRVEQGEYPNTRQVYLPMLCNHCDEPSCVDVCPTGATHKREEDGIVVIDADECVGCRACMTACPYHARYYLDEIRGYYPGQGLTPYEKARYPEHSRRTVEKCNFCMDRLARRARAGVRGQLPGRGPHLRRPRRSRQRAEPADQAGRRLSTAPGDGHRSVGLLPARRDGRPKEVAMNQPLALYRDLEAVYRPQRVWAEGRAVRAGGRPLLSGVGAGGWLIGLVLDIPLVLSMSLAAVVLSGIVHLAFLGHPERALEDDLRPRSSWISRGLWSIMIFVPTAALYLAGAYGAWSTRSALLASSCWSSPCWRWAASSCTKASSMPYRGRWRLWHSPLLPVSYIAIGVRGGAAAGLVAWRSSPVRPATRCRPGGWRPPAPRSSCSSSKWPWAARSYHRAVARPAGPRRPGLACSTRSSLLLGVIVPAALVVASYATSVGNAGLIIAGILSLAGDLAYKYCMNTAGTYVPLVQAKKRAEAAVQ